jgi:glycosyltransferase involved in cell wall biosynthesis
MKVILGTESFKPNVSGVAVATEILANNLSKAGHEVFVFCPGVKDKDYIDKDFKDFTVMRLKSIPNPFRQGFRVTSASKKDLYNKVIEIQPDIIHLQDIATIGTNLRNIGKELNVPVVITNHFSLEFALSYVRFRFLMPIAKKFLIKYLVNFYNKCDYVVTPTQTIADQVISWGTKTPVIAISNGIFFDKFAKKLPKKEIQKFKLDFHIPNNQIVLYVGRVDRDKSIDVLIKAIPDILKSVNAHFVIAGTGDLVEEMEKLVDELNVRKNVTFLGRLDNTKPEFIALYKSASVFAIPSTIETQSLVTLEAMSAGAPVVGAEANALPEIIRNGLNGYLFTPGDSKEMADKIVKILKNKKMAHKMSDHSMDLASHHEMSKTFDTMLNLYFKAIKEKQNKKALTK